MGINNQSELIKRDKIRVLIDADSLNLSVKKDPETLLAYRNSPYLEMIRTSYKGRNGLIQGLPTYELLKAKDGTEFIELKTENGVSRQLFGYRHDDITRIAKEIYQLSTLQKGQVDLILTVFIQACFNSRKDPCILVTESEVILKNRFWFEAHFPGGHLNIMDLSEVILFIDLFFKAKGKYFLSGRFELNKGFWYWLSMRTKLEHYNVDDDVINALANRFQFALMALDEIGTQYYSGVNNDIMSNTEYHFNYLISLITGIFDNLAIKTNNLYNLQQKPPFKISLSKSCGKEFRNKIKINNAKLAKHIDDFENLIELVYSLREIIIHRELLAKSTFEFRGRDCNWKSNVIEISQKTLDQINKCGNKKSPFLPFSDWGVYIQDSVNFLIPFYFSKEILSMLIPFVDEYLRLIGYPSFVKNEIRKKTSFANDIERFKKYHLGF